MRRGRVVSANCEGTAKFYDSNEDKQSCSEYLGHVTNGGPVNERFSALVNITESVSKCLETSFTFDGDRTLVDGDQTIIENNTDSQSNTLNSTNCSPNTSPAKLSKPPPLPPKPKNLVNVVKSGYIISPKPNTVQRPNHVID